MTAGGGEIIKKLEDTTRDAARHQSETLRYILDHNGGVSYLRRYLGSYNEPVDADTFRSAVPLSRYEDYADYINKMADGVLTDENDGGRPLLSVDPLTCFFYSSGTSSMKPKLIPYFDSKPAKEISAMAHQSSFANVSRLFPPRPSVNKARCGFSMLAMLQRRKVDTRPWLQLHLLCTMIPKARVHRDYYRPALVPEK